MKKMAGGRMGPESKKRPALAGLCGLPGSPALYDTCRKFRRPTQVFYASAVPRPGSLVCGLLCRDAHPGRV
jgi:hypothetical protein